MGRCLYESGEKLYNRVLKATGAHIRAFATPKGYVVTVNGPQEAVENTVQMLQTAIVRPIRQGLGGQIFGNKKEFVESISKHTGSTIYYGYNMKPRHSYHVVALCPSSESRKKVSDILDNPPMKIGLSDQVVHWLRTKGPNGLRIDDILKQTGVYIHIEKAVYPWRQDQCYEALIFGSQRATETAKSLIRECDTIKKIEVSRSFARKFKASGEPKRLPISTNTLVFVEHAEPIRTPKIVIVGPASSVAAAAEQIEARLSSS